MFINDFMEFMNLVHNSYTCVNFIKNLLIINGFKELEENRLWDNLEEAGKYFVIRNDSSIIAFKYSRKHGKFNIVLSHSDSPSFSIKPNPEIFSNGYLKLNTNGYGGKINYTWFDRPLSISGRVILNKGDKYIKEIIDIDKNLLLIPSQAIHINRDVNSNAKFNDQIDMLPIISLSNIKFEDIIKQYLEENGIEYNYICDYDLYLYNRDKAIDCGAQNEFIMSPRLDDLGSVYPSLLAFIDSANNNSIDVFGVFNNEEIGSMTMQGADSNFLKSVLERISNYMNISADISFSNSFVVSADNAHAFHPNAMDKNDLTNKVMLNNGIVIKHNVNYSTDSISSTLFKGICNRAGISYQDYTCRSDMRCGSTIGKINQKYISVPTVDIGIAQLAMHSANEVVGKDDIENMYKALLEFYNSSIILENNEYRIEK